MPPPRFKGIEQVSTHTLWGKSEGYYPPSFLQSSVVNHTNPSISSLDGFQSKQNLNIFVPIVSRNEETSTCGLIILQLSQKKLPDFYLHLLPTRGSKSFHPTDNSGSVGFAVRNFPTTPFGASQSSALEQIVCIESLSLED